MIPSISVIIPTHNRCDGLRQTLAALCCQNIAADRFEVVVVADGCHDETASMVRAYPAAYHLVCLEQPASGPAAARNRGASETAAPLLLFLDDDIEASPGLVGAHLAAHQDAAAANDPLPVVIGYLPTILEEQKGLFRAVLRGWWEDIFQTMGMAGHRFSYTDLLSGNFSLTAAAFRESGGFDTSLRCHEDYELGYRLIRAGARMRFVRDAMGWHHEKTQMERSLRRKREEGLADVALGTLYPELRPGLLAARLWNNCALPPKNTDILSVVFALCSRLVRRAAFSAPWLGDIAVQGIRGVLTPLERLKARRLWRLLLDVLMAYWYWRGVAEALPGLTAAARFLQDSKIPVPDLPLGIDLAEGIGPAEAKLDRERPAFVELSFAGQVLGSLPAIAGAEPLRGIHLRAALATTFADKYAGIVFSDGANLRNGNETMQQYESITKERPI